MEDSKPALQPATNSEEQNPIHVLLQGYSQLRLGADEVMDALHLCCLEDLYALTRAHGLPLPSINSNHAEVLTEKAIRLLRDSDHA